MRDERFVFPNGLWLLVDDLASHELTWATLNRRLIPLFIRPLVEVEQVDQNQLCTLR